MPNIYVPANSPDDWKKFLKDPDKQWKSKYSAKTIAHCWQESDGFPASIKRAFDNSKLDAFRQIEMLLALPEHQVPLPPEGGRPTQCDIFVLARTTKGLMSIAVEGKVREPFGPIVKEWLAEGGDGKRTRINYLCDLLGLTIDEVSEARYQLLHRTAASILEARRFGASQALMLVHSFSQTKEWFGDFALFAKLMGIASPSPDSIASANRASGLDLYLGWVTGEAEFLSR